MSDIEQRAHRIARLARTIPIDVDRLGAVELRFDDAPERARRWEQVARELRALGYLD